MDFNEVRSEGIIIAKSLIDITFNPYHNILPTKEQVKKLLGEKCRAECFIREKYIREMYIDYSFPILTHNFLISLKKVCTKIKVKKIAEICAGSGWFSWWMKKYGIEVSYTIDSFSREYSHLSLVVQDDAVNFVSTHKEIELFILSWPPYNTPLAFNIWNDMKVGQYLLYIGENEGGCTADDKFFKAVHGCELEKESNLLDKHYLQFELIFDHPKLYRKE